MFHLNFKINLKLNFKLSFYFIWKSVKFYFISVFYFKVTSKAFLFYLLFKKFNLSMWPISANTNLGHGPFLEFYEYS